VDETLQKAGYPVLETLDGVGSRATGVPICRVRGKIEPAPDNPTRIVAARGIGHRVAR